MGTTNEAGHGFDRFEEGLPFGIIVDANVSLGSGESSVTISKLIADLADQRGSFGFLETTCTTFALEETWVARISAGQESRAELIETFFGLGRMLRQGRRQGRLSEPAPADNPSSRKLGQPVTFDLQQMLSEANKTAASAAMVVMERVPPEVWVDQALRILRRRSAAGEHVATGEGQRDVIDVAFSSIRQLLATIAQCLNPEAVAAEDVDDEQDPDAVPLRPIAPGGMRPGQRRVQA